MRLALTLLAVGSIPAGISYGQQVVSAHAGVVHYVEGRVFVGNHQVQQKFGQFPDLQPGEVLRTEAGRAEVLLTPGAFLRLSEDSSVRMLSRELSNPSFELLSGSVMVECDDVPKGEAVTLRTGDRSIVIEKHGLYRVDAEPGLLRVYDGKAVVHAGSEELTVGGGKEASLTGVLVAEKFDAKTGDTFYAWNGLRSGYIASANVSAARGLLASGSSWNANGWMFDPFFGAFTFVPYNGLLYSPYGWAFWSPAYVMYAPPPVYGGGGFVGSGFTGGGRPGTIVGSRPGAPPRVGTSGSVPVAGGAPASVRGAAAPRAIGGFGGPADGGMPVGVPSGGFSGGGFSGGGVSAGGGGVAHGGGMAAGGGGASHAGGGGGGVSGGARR
jgi:hypothetical protein